MKLLTQAIKKALPPLYSQDGKGEDALAVVKFFTPDSSWTWYASEASAALADGDYVALTDPKAATAEDVTFFGKVVGLETELGYFSLNELTSAKGPLGLPIERDLHFKPKALKECA